MSGLIEPLGSQPFRTDPAMIAGPVLRAFVNLALQRLPGTLAARFRATAGSVGLAGLWCALTLDRAAVEQLGLAVEAALAAVARQPEMWRRAGSDLAAGALGLIQPDDVLTSTVPSKRQRRADRR